MGSARMQASTREEVIPETHEVLSKNPHLRSPGGRVFSAPTDSDLTRSPTNSSSKISKTSSSSKKFTLDPQTIAPEIQDPWTDGLGGVESTVYDPELADVDPTSDSDSDEADLNDLAGWAARVHAQNVFTYVLQERREHGQQLSLGGSKQRQKTRPPLPYRPNTTTSTITLPHLHQTDIVPGHAVSYRKPVPAFFQGMLTSPTYTYYRWSSVAAGSAPSRILPEVPGKEKKKSPGEIKRTRRNKYVIQRDAWPTFAGVICEAKLIEEWSSTGLA